MKDIEFKKDLGWLRELQSKMRDDVPLSKEERKKCLSLLIKHKDDLVFEPGSGKFGFGVSLNVYELIWSTFPGLPSETVRVISLTNLHLFPHTRNKNKAYKLFSGFSHTSINKQLRKEAGFLKALKDYSYYDY